MTIHVENPKELNKKNQSNKQLLKVARSLSKVPGYNVSMQTLIPILYINNEQLEFEIKKHNAIYISAKTR
jgi:hypothetical protein